MTIYNFLVQPVFFRFKTVNKNRQIYAKMTSLNIGRPILTHIFSTCDHFENRKSNKKGNLTFSVFHNIALKSNCTYFFYENATFNWRRVSLRYCALLMHFKYWWLYDFMRRFAKRIVYTFSLTSLRHTCFPGTISIKHLKLLHSYIALSWKLRF